MKGALLGMGNPLLDISADVGQELLDKYEVTLNNAILAEAKHVPLYDELAAAAGVEYIAGGATQNSIRVAQWMLGAEGATAYIGCVGKDAFGAQLKASAEKDGLVTHYMEDESAATGTCAVLIKDKERSLVANLSAANNYKIDHMNTEAIQAVVAAAKVVYSAGFFLTVSPASMIAAGKHAAESGGYFATNLSAPFLCSVFKEQMHSVLPYADIVFGNESEAAAYAEANECAGASIPEVAKKIAALPKACGTHARVVVITQGSESTVVAVNGTVTEYAVTPIAGSAIVDTNGAGDSFVGGFLSQFLTGAPLAKCVDAGHWAAGLVIQQSGCTFPAECTYSA